MAVIEVHVPTEYLGKVGGTLNMTHVFYIDEVNTFSNTSTHLVNINLTTTAFNTT